MELGERKSDERATFSVCAHTRTRGCHLSSICKGEAVIPLNIMVMLTEIKNP